MKKLFLSIVLVLPLVYLVVNVQEANDPIKYIYIHTGMSALILLLLSLSISPLRKVINVLKYRRLVGLFAFFYAFLHFLTFFILDAEFDISFVIKETLDKPFIYLGMISFVILTFMAITSTKKLFSKVKKWHQLVYIVLILVTIHESMAQKVLSSLEYTFIACTCILLGYRLYKKFGSTLQEKFHQKNKCSENTRQV